MGTVYWMPININRAVKEQNLGKVSPLDRVPTKSQDRDSQGASGLVDDHYFLRASLGKVPRFHSCDRPGEEAATNLLLSSEVAGLVG